MAGEGDGLTDVFHLAADGVHLAFRYLAPRPNALIESGRVKLLDGGRPFHGDVIVCGTCGAELYRDEVQPERWAD